ncbi:MAG: hypothetical protein PHC88_15220 [Terrimicrobiaceae bacterium]|nr:hypothetical protein [Terrimicrobiaceae bacterium]
MTRLAACFLFLGLIDFARAELPPSVYEKMQSAAVEVVRVKVLRVDVQPGDDPAIRDVTMLVQVLKVGRTRTKLKQDDLITVKYRITTHESGWVGPGEVPILKEDMETVAYLQPIVGSQDYAPAAGAMSFDRF